MASSLHLFNLIWEYYVQNGNQENPLQKNKYRKCHVIQNKNKSVHPTREHIYFPLILFGLEYSTYTHTQYVKARKWKTIIFFFFSKTNKNEAKEKKSNFFFTLSHSIDFSFHFFFILIYFVKGNDKKNLDFVYFYSEIDKQLEREREMVWTKSYIKNKIYTRKEVIICSSILVLVLRWMLKQLYKRRQQKRNKWYKSGRLELVGWLSDWLGCLLWMTGWLTT